MSKITVAIPTANNPQDLAVLLVQLQSQRPQVPMQIYIADNSPDGYVLDMVKRYQFSVSIYVQRKAGTIHDSWNKGLAFDKGHCIVLNDDIMIPEDFIYRMMRAFDDGKHCVCPSSQGFPPIFRVRKGYHWDTNFIQGSGKEQSYTERTAYSDPYLPVMTGWCFGLSQQVIEEVGLFDTAFTLWYGDTDMDRRIMERYPITFINELFVHHFGSTSTMKMKKKKFSIVNHDDQRTFEQKYGLPHQYKGWCPEDCPAFADKPKESTHVD